MASLLATRAPFKAVQTQTHYHRRCGRVQAIASAQPEQWQRRAPAAWTVGLAAAGVLLLSAPQAQAGDAAATFTKSCAGCHVNGGNVIRRDATLQLPDLQKFGVDSQEALYQVIYSGKGSMPGFGQECAPRGACTFGPRLADEDIQELAAYVLENAQAGWPESQP